MPTNPIKIESLIIKNFKAFREEITINFENKNLLIYGNNGAGKSSIFWALYTIIQSTTKQPEEIKKYFKIYDSLLPETKQSLRNIFESDNEESYLKLKITDDVNVYKISLDDIANLDQQNLKTLTATSDFINYKLLSNFYNISHKYDLNLWSIFERDVFPFLIKPNTNPPQNYLDYIISRTRDAPRYSNNRYFRPGHNKRNFENNLANFNLEISGLLAEIQRFANEFIQEHFYNNEEALKIELDYDKQFNFNMLKKRLWREENKHIRNEELRIRLIVKQKDNSNNNWKTIERVQSLLNEAQLTRIAFSIRIGALRSRVQTLYPKILVIDDMLISLDMSNRLDIAKMILNVNNKSSLNFFDSYQKIILTHDKAFFRILKNYTNDLEWDYYNLTKDERSTSSPQLKEEISHLKKAENFLSSSEYDACGNELRKEMELTLKKYLTKGQKIIDEEYSSLKSMLNKAYDKFVNNERRNFKRNFLNSGIEPRDLEKIRLNFEDDLSLSEETKQKLLTLKNNLFSYLLRMNSITENKDLIFDDLNVFLDRIMNPSSHSTSEPLYEEELKKAIELIKNFKQQIEN